MDGLILILMGTIYGAGLVWGIWPLLCARPWDEKSRFSLADMYALVLQFALAGLLLSAVYQGDREGRFLIALIPFSAVLALIWGCILSALNERGVQGSLRRFAVFLFAPLHILCCLCAPFLIAVGFSNTHWNRITALLLLSLCVPLAARVLFSWAVGRNARPGATL